MRILACLGTGRKTVSELRVVCRLSQSAVSQHLMKLRTSGAVRSEKRGRERVYQAADHALAHICRSIIKLIQK
jgi:DNA-binding transcriptional ArsR family regulator